MKKFHKSSKFFAWACLTMPMPIYRAYKEPSICTRAKQKRANTIKTSQQSFHSNKEIDQSKFQPMSTFGGQGMIKKRIFSHIDGCQNAKSQNMKFFLTESATLYNVKCQRQKSEETNDAFSSKCWITLLLGPFWRQKPHWANFDRNGSFREKSENVVI